MKWNKFERDGIEYDLSHLNPFEWHLQLQNADLSKPIKYRFNVEFSMHCFTEGKAIHEDAKERNDASWLYHGPKESRLFCIERYDLSKQLPAIIKSLDKRACWHTHNGNFFTIELQNSNGGKSEYEIYFDVFKSAKGWLNLMVKSAYIRDASYGTAQPRKRRIRFSILVKNRFEGKKLHPPR